MSRILSTSRDADFASARPSFSACDATDESHELHTNFKGTRHAVKTMQLAEQLAVQLGWAAHVRRGAGFMNMCLRRLLVTSSQSMRTVALEWPCHVLQPAIDSPLAGSECADGRAVLS